MLGFNAALTVFSSRKQISIPTSDEESDWLAALAAFTFYVPQGCWGKGVHPMMLGIDVSSCSLHSALCSQEAVAPKWRKQVPNSVAGIRELLAATPADIPMVVEPTGRYSLLLVEQARSPPRLVLSAPHQATNFCPYRIHSRGESEHQGRRARG